MSGSPVSPRAAAGCLAMVVLVASSHASAQLKGDYLPGFTGLQNGSQPPPGISLGLTVNGYPTHTMKDDAGNTIGDLPHVTTGTLGFTLLWVTNVRLFGGNLGGQITPLCYVRSRIETHSLDVPGSWAFTDVFVQPLWLGWSKPRADFSAAWGFFAPTGSWTLEGSDNAGLGMWANDFQLGTTVRLDEHQAWTSALLATYEIDGRKRNTDIRVGDILTLEGGTGKAFYRPVARMNDPQVVNVGLAYYGQFKVTSDRGSGPRADALLAGAKDRVFGLGGEASIQLPKPSLFLDLRVVPEFGARNRTQGITIVFTASYELKSLIRAPAPE